jgi:hypothetical protein
VKLTALKGLYDRKARATARRPERRRAAAIAIALSPPKAAAPSRPSRCG